MFDFHVGKIYNKKIIYIKGLVGEAYLDLFYYSLRLCHDFQVHQVLQLPLHIRNSINKSKFIEFHRSTSTLNFVLVFENNWDL